MMYPLVLDLAVDKIPVAVTCRVLGFSTQAFYAWKRNPVTRRDWDDAHLINAAREVHADDPEFGYRFIADELAERGYQAGENRVQRLCRQERLWSVHAKKRGLHRKPGPPVHDDLVDRDFTADRPNQLWLAGITEHRTGEGLYLCAIKDCCSNKIVGYAIDERMKTSLAVRALRNAIALRNPPAGARSTPTAGASFGPGPSCAHWPTTGCPGPWAGSPHVPTTPPWSPFSHCCRRIVLDRRRWASRDELRLAIVVWIERTYHRRRRQRRLGKLTPIEFEMLHQPVATAA